jgi:hypothetical protein
MTDVTILFPPPASLDFVDDMLSPTSELERGELMPSSIYENLVDLPAPPMVGSDGKPLDLKKPLFQQWKDSFALLRVVGIRLDPCFGQSTHMGAASCKNTIRLTAQFLQPFRTDFDGRVAIHLFYEISREEFTTLAKSMLALRKTTGLPLQKSLFTGHSRGPHPTMLDEGLRGAYATALKDLILQYAGEQTLTQIAFCVQDRGAAASAYYGDNGSADSRWVFGRFEYARGANGGYVTPGDISTLNYTGFQTVDSAAPTEDRAAVVVTPASTVPDNFLRVFNREVEENGTIDATKIQKAMRSARALSNPLKYTPQTADCVSCHMAKQATQSSVGAAPADFSSYTYRLDNTGERVGPFRMFGYDSSNNAIVSERVVNETVVVLDYLNKVVMR